MQRLMLREQAETDRIESRSESAMMQWSYDTLLKWGTDELTAHSVDNASVDAWYLLEHIYGISRVDFLIRRNDRF